MEPRFELDDDLGCRALAHAARAPDRRGIFAHDRPFQYLEARGAQDIEPDLRTDSIDLDQHLEHVQLGGRGEPIEGELVLSHVRVDVQLDLSAWGWQQLSRGRGDADHVADPADVDHHEVGARASHHAREMGDHWNCALRAPGGAATLVKRRLRPWQIAMAIASRACSASRPARIFTCAASMRAICALSAFP